MIVAIGPAPKIGRPRWLQLVKGLEPAGARGALDEVLDSADFQSRDSDQRFAMALQAVGSPQRPAKRRLASPDRVAWVEKKGRQVRLVSDNPAFASFIQQRLPALLEEFAGSAEAKADKQSKGSNR